MDYAAIIALVSKGLQLIPVLIQAKHDVEPVIDRLKKLLSGTAAGTVTDADLTSTEAFLDALIEEFNAPMPD